jgi:YesN/AraC family two-component response regulator
MIKVIIVDDHHIVKRGLKQIVDKGCKGGLL